MPLNKSQGFTLIELSIVLVIIGLIVGGVLVGRDMIDAAAIRAQISQFEKYDAAVNTFRTKYNGLPGDLRSDQASAMGFAQRAGTPGHGDGDGILEFCDGLPTSTYQTLGCEDALFWNDLGAANLIDGNFSADTDSPSTTGTLSMTGVFPSPYLPAAKIGNGNSVAIFTVAKNSFNSLPAACGGTNFCYAVAKVLGGLGSAYVLTAGITPAQMYSIDSKIDDGLPNSGRVQGSKVFVGLGYNFWATFGDTTTGACLATGANGGVIYNTTSSASAQTPACMINVVHQ